VEIKKNVDIFLFLTVLSYTSRIIKKESKQNDLSGRGIPEVLKSPLNLVKRSE